MSFLHQLQTKKHIDIIENHIAPTGIISVDGQIIYANNALCYLLEYASDELYKKSSNEVLHPVDINTCLQMLSKCLSKEINGFILIQRYITKTEKIIYAKVSYKLYDNGQQYFMIYVVPLEEIIHDVGDKISSIDILSLIRNHLKEFIICCITAVTFLVGFGTTFYVQVTKVEYLEKTLEETQRILRNIEQNVSQ